MTVLVPKSFIRHRPPRIAMLFALLAAAADWLSGYRLQIAPAYPFMGTVLGAAGFGVMLRAWWLFKQAGVAICPTAHTSRLVTDGPYRLTRHPMYLGVVSMMAALAVGIGSAPFYAAAVAYFAVIDRVFCPYEEAKLTALFGDEYRAYCSRVRRWIPIVPGTAESASCAAADLK